MLKQERIRIQNILVRMVAFLPEPETSSRFQRSAINIVNFSRRRDTELEGTVNLSDAEAVNAVNQAFKNIIESLRTSYTPQGPFLPEDIIGVLASVSDAKQQWILYNHIPVSVVLNREIPNNVSII